MDWHLVAVLAEVLWLAGVVVWIAFERRPPASTLAWIVGLALLPVVGVPVYWFFGPRRLARKKRRYRGLRERLEHQLVELAREPSLPPDVVRQVRLGVRLDEAPLATATALEPYRDGVALFAALCRDVASARHSLNLEYYIWEPDATGRRLLELLVERARAGVRVRVLVDALGTTASLRFFAPLAAAGGRVARFNPPRLAPLRSRLLNFRTHRKIAVLDGRVGYLGGMNISAANTTGAGGAPPWRDCQLRLEGTAVRSLQRTFYENWQFATGDDALDPLDFPALAEGGVRLQVLRSGPDREVYPIHEFLFTAIAGADERVWLTSPYVVPDEPMLTALRSAAHRGVDVRLLVPARGDSRLVAAASRSFQAELAASGVHIWEYGPAMLHAKTLVVDRELAMVGSANLDNRSFRLNFEVAAAIYDAGAADCLAAWFEEDLVGARRISLRDALRRRWPARLAEAGARLFAAVL